MSAVIGHGTDGARLPVYAQQVAPATADELLALPPVTVDLARPGSISGTGVTKGRSIHLMDLSGAQIDFRNGSTAGNYRFGDLVPGRYQLRAVSASDSGAPPVIDVAAGQTATWTASIPARSTISGRVHVAGRAPRHRVPIEVAMADGSWSSGAWTAKSGRYSVSRLLPGSCRITFGGSASPDNRGGEQQRTRTATITAPGQHVRQDVDLARGAIVTGRVLGVPVLPVYGALATVVAVDAHGRVASVVEAQGTTSTASFRFSGLASGRYRISAIVRGRMVGVSARARVGHTADVGAMRASRPTSTLTGSTGRKRVDLDVLASDGGWVSGARSSSTGRFRVTGLVPGTYRVVARKQNFADRSVTVRVTRSTRHDIAAGARTDYGTVTGIASAPDAAATGRGS